MTLAGRVRAAPLPAFFLLAYAITWPLAALTPVSLAFGLLALFGPAVAAFVVARIVDGPAGVAELLARIRLWRIGVGWYLLVFLIPLAVSGVVSLVALTFGFASRAHFTAIAPLSILIFVLVVGEEIGWRGFALPRLLARFGPGRASLILGVLWGFWHFPTFFIAGAPQAEVPIVAYIAYTTALSGAFTWVWLRTRGSVLLATLLHGAVNAVGFTAVGLPAANRMWLTAGAWAVAALLLLALGQERRATARSPLAT